MTFAEDIWNSGIPLDAARNQYCDPSVRAKYDERKRQYQSPESLMATLSKQSGTDLQVPDQKNPLIQIVVLATLAVEAIWGRRDLEINVAWKLQNRQLIAAGYASPRRHDDLPKIIPPDVWEGQIDWTGSSVVGNGLGYFAVRVGSPMIVTPKLIEHESTQPPNSVDSEIRRLPGRPGVQHFIVSAYEGLSQQGFIDLDRPRTELYPTIREILVRTHPEDAKRFERLSDKTIARHTRAPFEREKKARTKL